MGSMQSRTYNNQRQSQRHSFQFPVEINIGSQITLQGRLKDLSLKSAFITVKSNIYMQPHDELNFTIQCALNDGDKCVQGAARVSRIAVGEGIAIYFTELDETSSNRLKQLVGGSS